MTHGHADAVEIAHALMAVDTQNPPGGEQALLSVVSRLLSEITGTATVGAPVVVEPAPGRTSAVVTLPSHGGPEVVINAHLDVAAVASHEWQRCPSGEVADGYLYGRGSADMKGGLACVLAALRRIYRRGEVPAAVVSLHLVADEEQGSRLGAAVLADFGLVGAPDLCLIPEPTALGVACVERGVAWLQIRLRVDRAKAGVTGASAVAPAAAVLQAFDGRPWGREHDLLPPRGCNVGEVTAGSLPNRAAAEATIRVDVRVQPGDSAVRVARWARSTAEVAVADLGLQTEVDVSVTKFAPATETSPSTPLMQSFSRAACESTGPTAMEGPTDARYYRSRGIPTVVFGPGDPQYAHQPDERVALVALADATAVYERFLVREVGR